VKVTIRLRKENAKEEVDTKCELEAATQAVKKIKLDGMLPSFRFIRN